MGPNSDVVPLCLTCPGRQWLGPFPVGLPRGLAAGLTREGLRSCSNCCCCVEFAMQIDQDLIAALYVLGFNFLDGFSGEIAEIKGDMTIKLVHPPGEELKFVVELPGEKQMTFSVDRSQIVTFAEWQ